MNYGLPAVAVSGGGASEVIEDGMNGFTSKNEPEALAKSINKVLANEELWARLSEGAVATAREHSPEAMVSRVLEVYRRAIDQNLQANPEAALAKR
jgi:glycosyltransferase involved in cell wall biosynthesis